jgi:hypothetical protein
MKLCKGAALELKCAEVMWDEPQVGLDKELYTA